MLTYNRSPSHCQARSSHDSGTRKSKFQVIPPTQPESIAIIFARAIVPGCHPSSNIRATRRPIVEDAEPKSATNKSIVYEDEVIPREHRIVYDPDRPPGGDHYFSGEDGQKRVAYIVERDSSGTIISKVKKSEVVLKAPIHDREVIAGRDPDTVKMLPDGTRIIVKPGEICIETNLAANALCNNTRKVSKERTDRMVICTKHQP